MINFLSILLTVVWMSACTKGVAPKRSLNAEMEKVSYSIGFSIGRSMKQQDLQLDQEAFIAGLIDARSAAKPVLDEAAQSKIMREFQMSQQKKAQDKREKDASKNGDEGKRYLEANKKKEGIKVTKSGLQYKVIKPGTGAKPKAEDTVVTHYKGTLIDGTEFDSSYSRNQPATFPVKGVIKGWTEALQLMPVGSKWQLFIPSDLAYGERGSGPKIGPNSTLIFEVELLEIKKKG